MPLIGHEVYRMPCQTCGAPSGEPCHPECPTREDEDRPGGAVADDFRDQPWDHPEY
jgi:hypothetical protein